MFEPGCVAQCSQCLMAGHSLQLRLQDYSTARLLEFEIRTELFGLEAPLKLVKSQRLSLSLFLAEIRKVSETFY